MGILWSPSTGHFYHTDIHGADAPDDGVAVTVKRHAKLVDGRNHGQTIKPDACGKPHLVATSPAAPTVEDVVAAIKREARRRILAIASIERQSNDNAAIALGDKGPPLDRRLKIDAVRVASNIAEEAVAKLSAAALAKFNPSAEALWPQDFAA